MLSLEYSMQSAGTVAQAINRACFESDDNWEGLKRVSQSLFDRET